MDATDTIAVIAAYNEAATIREVAERTLRQVRALIVVDDGSGDGTGAALEGLPLELLRNPVNLGKGASLWRGMQRALELGAQAVITLDGDGQHRPEDIPALLEVHRRRPEAIVIGSRLHLREEMPALRYRANRFADFWVGLAAGRSFPDTQSGFRVYPARLLHEARVDHGASARFAFESEILIEAGRLGIESVAVPVTVAYRGLARASHFANVADVARIARMVARRLLARYTVSRPKAADNASASGVPSSTVTPIARSTGVAESASAPAEHSTARQHTVSESSVRLRSSGSRGTRLKNSE
ncbi:MAG TPA: glycosyltransferase family 2 protein [Burkholderiales bacterium]|nr:glycosyltransferase family 2 protein [Burkholderiales bacterium]